MYIEQTPNPADASDLDYPGRAPESGEPLDRTPVSRDPDVGSEAGNTEDLAPESGGRSDLSSPAPARFWPPSEAMAPPDRVPPTTRPGSTWFANALLAAGIALTAGVVVSAIRRRGGYSFAGRAVIITGGSRGLGLVMARQLASEGAHLVLLARNERELQRAKEDLRKSGADVLAILCDVTRREDIESAIRQAAERLGRIDVLINNAGLIQVGPLQHMRVEDFEQAMSVHLWGPLYTTMAVLPYMRRQGEGRIVNISSIGGKIAFPHLAPYSASKFALTGLSDALRSELRRENILVTTVCPGLMRTGSPPNVSLKGRHQEEYAWFAISGSLPLLSINADRAARRIIEACRRGAPRLIIGVQAKAAAILNELAPGLAARMMSIVNRLLPDSAPGGSPEERTGWESQSKWAPSRLTAMTYQAARENNETNTAL